MKETMNQFDLDLITLGVLISKEINPQKVSTKQNRVR